MSVVEVRPHGRKVGSGVMRWVMLLAFLFAPCSACDPPGRGYAPPAAEGEVFLHLEEASSCCKPSAMYEVINEPLRYSTRVETSFGAHPLSCQWGSFRCRKNPSSSWDCETSDLLRR
jgi:hypothetical protein